MQMFSVLVVVVCLSYRATADFVDLPFSFADHQSTGSGDDYCTSPIPAYVSLLFPYTSETFSNIHVCSNGLVCFDSATTEFSPKSNGDTHNDAKDCFVPFWADLNAGTSQTIVYQQYNIESGSALESQIQDLVRDVYCSYQFQPVYLLVVTWNEATFFGSSSAMVSFQFVYVTDGEAGFAFYFYKKDGFIVNSGRNIFIGLIADGVLSGDDDSMSNLEQPDVTELLTSHCYGCKDRLISRGGRSYAFGDFKSLPCVSRQKPDQANTPPQASDVPNLPDQANIPPQSPHN